MGAGRSTDRHQVRCSVSGPSAYADGARDAKEQSSHFGGSLLTGRKPSRGYSNPEGGRCRGMEPPGKPDLSRWHVSKGTEFQESRSCVNRVKPVAGEGASKRETPRMGQAEDRSPRSR